MNEASIKPMDRFQGLAEDAGIPFKIGCAGQEGIRPILDVSIFLLFQNRVPHGMKVTQGINRFYAESHGKVFHFPVSIEYSVRFDPRQRLRPFVC